MPCRPLWPVLLLLVSLPDADAQENFEPRDLTRGVAIPGAGIAGDHDASAVSLNPAGVAALGGPSISFAYDRLASEDTRIGNAGWALSLGLPLRLNLPRQTVTLAYGFGYQSLNNPDSWVGPVPGGENQDGSYILNSLAFGTPELSIGYAIGNYFWADTPQSESIITHHAGLSLRPSRFFALGWTIRDVFEPVGRTSDEKFRRSYETELMLRPLGDWRLEVGGGARTGKSSREDAGVLSDYYGRAQIRPLDGIALFGQYESVERHFGDPAAAPRRDNRVTFGLSFDGIDSLFSNRPRIGMTLASSISSRGPDPYAASSGVFRWSAEKYPPLIEKKHVEQISIKGEIGDREFVVLLHRIQNLIDNDDVAGVVMEIGPNSLGWGRTEELRDAILKLHAAGKDSVAYLRDGRSRPYYLASGCTKVVVHPTASFALTGISSRLFYIREMLAKLGIATQVLKIGDYKSAPEMFTEDGPSSAAKQQIEAFQADLMANFVASVAISRGLKEEAVRKLSKRPVITPPAALAEGLVDHIAHPDQLQEALEAHFGSDIRVTSTSSIVRRPKQWAFPKIAVIHVDGEILPGKSETGLFSTTIGGEDIAAAIKHARESSRVRAIILRVNSPGGVVEPSEQIAREVELTRGHKPIIVSMGDVAASGGYMVSAFGEQIFAPKGSLTGSIGIFAIRLNIVDLLQKIGVKTTAVKQGEHSDSEDLSRPWTDFEKRSRYDEISYLYGRFVALVASGRGLSTTKVEALAGGHVYSGEEAQKNGLVDHSGSFLDALAVARKRAEISPSTRIALVQEPTISNNFLGQLLGVKSDSVAEVVAKLPPALRTTLRAIPEMLWAGGGLMARLPFVQVTEP